MESQDVILERARNLAKVGLKPAQIAKLIGLTTQEAKSLNIHYPEIMEAIDQGKAEGLVDMASTMYELAKTGDLRAIQAMMLLTGGEEYRTDKPSVSIQHNNVMILPSTSREALQIIQEDPALLEGDTVDA